MSTVKDYCDEREHGRKYWVKCYKEKIEEGLDVRRDIEHYLGGHWRNASDAWRSSEKGVWEDMLLLLKEALDEYPV